MPEEARGKGEESAGEKKVVMVVVVEKGGGGQSGERGEDLSANITHVANPEISSNTV